MGSDRPLHLVDVFAESKYAGNQLAVVRDADGLGTDEMQTIAREMNYSETTFVAADEPTDRGWAVRIFTPANEIPFAGHPTLGTAHVIREHLADGRPDELVLDLAVGRIPVTVARDDAEEVYWMRQNPPAFGETVSREAAAEMLGLAAADVADRAPVQAVSTGLPTVVVPLADVDAVRRAEVADAAYREHAVDRLDAENVLVFAPEAERPENDLHVRMFAPAHGVPEDPATGSSNGCLAGYLARHEYLGSPRVDVRVEQGYEMGRPSLLLLRADASGDEVTVDVGGGVVPVAEGRLL